MYILHIFAKDISSSFLFNIQKDTLYIIYMYQNIYKQEYTHIHIYIYNKQQKYPHKSLN